MKIILITIIIISGIFSNVFSQTQDSIEQKRKNEFEYKRIATESVETKFNANFFTTVMNSTFSNLTSSLRINSSFNDELASLELSFKPFSLNSVLNVSLSQSLSGNSKKSVLLDANGLSGGTNLKVSCQIINFSFGEPTNEMLRTTSSIIIKEDTVKKLETDPSLKSSKTTNHFENEIKELKETLQPELKNYISVKLSGSIGNKKYEFIRDESANKTEELLKTNKEIGLSMAYIHKDSYFIGLGYSRQWVYKTEDPLNYVFGVENSSLKYTKEVSLGEPLLQGSNNLTFEYRRAITRFAFSIIYTLSSMDSNVPKHSFIFPCYFIPEYDDKLNFLGLNGGIFFASSMNGNDFEKLSKNLTGGIFLAKKFSLKN